MITPTHNARGVILALDFDGLGSFTEAELRAAIAAARRERIVADAYTRQQASYRELEVLYQAMCERVIDAEQHKGAT